ncbi:hypothetical protein LV84_01030 [Algoriphagus ratkowskyi]|uniref:Uncharacterized protein n=2 Tax=Algoriphagus ratkowskyi TaxID=57028 RepID=A0A2W7RHW5_9BACT|nr:hypothetical protein LV84_01030 [Algoriphagus ratkowskyi]
MKKMMIMTLAVLGMVLGSFAVVQPVKAEAGPCTHFVGDDGCSYADCGECLFWNCGGPTQHWCDV